MARTRFGQCRKGNNWMRAVAHQPVVHPPWPDQSAGMVEIRKAAEADQAAIVGLLVQAGLPTSDMPASNPRFMVIREDGNIIAAGGLQPFGAAGLVRSVVGAGKGCACGADWPIDPACAVRAQVLRASGIPHH